MIRKGSNRLLLVSTLCVNAIPSPEHAGPGRIWVPLDKLRATCVRPEVPQNGLIFSSPLFLCFLLLEISSSLAGVESSAFPLAAEEDAPCGISLTWVGGGKG